MAAARRSGAVTKAALLNFCCWALTIQLALANVTTEFLQYINAYRANVPLPAFTLNRGAACVAQQVADQYQGSACFNITGTCPVSGLEPQPDDAIMYNCKLQLRDVKDGYIATPTCVTNAGTNASRLAARNITRSSDYTAYVNDSYYVSAGAGSVDNSWFVLVLATNSSGGNFVRQSEDDDPDPSSHASLLSASLLLLTIFALVAVAFALG